MSGGLLSRLASPAKPEPTTEDVAQAMAEDLALANQLAQPVIEAVAGYRERCKAAGYDDVAAQQMSVDYHAGLLRTMLR